MPFEDAAFASFERKWLEANPEQATVAVFLAPDQRRRASAFGSLVHELEQTTFHVREPQVAAAKLEWWRNELIAGIAGASRHPITRELFADERARAIDALLWSALIEGAHAQFEMGSASTLSESVVGLSVFYQPVVMAEAALVAGDAAPAAANARLWISSHLLRFVAAHPGHERSLPLDLLARHGMSRSSLAEPSPQRAALLRDFLDVLHAELDGALAQASGASLGRRVRARLDLDVAVTARRSADPAAILARHPQGRRWRSLWLAWREARFLAGGQAPSAEGGPGRT